MISHCRINYRQLVSADQPGLVLDIAPLSDNELAFYCLDVTRAGDNGVLAALLLRALFNGFAGSARPTKAPFTGVRRAIKTGKSSAQTSQFTWAIPAICRLLSQ